MRTRGCGTRVELRPRYGNERAGPPYPHVSMKHARRKTLAGRFRGRPRPFRGGGWIGEWEPFAGNCHGLGGPHVGIESSRRYTGNSPRSEEHTSELQSPDHIVCRLLLEKKRTYA